MTCIIGAEIDDMVLIAGDIQGTSVNKKTVHTHPKTFNVGDIGIGFTSSYRFGQILEHNLETVYLPDDKSQIYPWLVKKLIPEIKSTLEKNGYTEGGVCLLGLHGELWKLQSDYSVIRSVNGFDAVGSGDEYALAALRAFCMNHNGQVGDPISTGQLSRYDGFDYLKKTMKIVSEFCPSVGSDCNIITA
ncbi:hypothetical protein PBI_SCTP2_469 [Salicola phage SCTP-2]|nr:hypothetical protein PBI_SCTP2_469 [Salicola phage SCTP-2]